MRFETQAVHAGQAPDPLTGAVVTPLTASTTFAQVRPGQTKGFDYSRAGNPTRKALEDCLAALEVSGPASGGSAGGGSAGGGPAGAGSTGGELAVSGGGSAGRAYAFALASGCACMHIIAQFLKPGDLILAEEDLYGGSLRLFQHLKESQGLKTAFADFSNLKTAAELLSRRKPRMIWLETPTNPLLKVIDIEAVHSLKGREEALLVADGTFAPPPLQQPLNLGADIVFHSATKYLGGHSDILGGAVIVRRDDLAERLRFFVKTLGPVLSPVDSALLLRSLKTLSLRMAAHNKNGLAVAEFLAEHSMAERVFYPGLSSHPQFAVAKRQMTGGGGVVSFCIKGGRPAAFAFLKALKLFILAESLGAVESLAEHPKAMTHSSFASAAVTDSLIRLSVGVEHIEDLKDDLRQALQQAAAR